MMSNEEIDWENLLNFDDGVDFGDVTLDPELDLGCLEDFLMKDDDDNCEPISGDYLKEFDLEVCDFLLDSSPSSEPEVVNVHAEGNGSSKLPSVESKSGGNESNDGGVDVNCVENNSRNSVSNCVENDKSSDDNVDRNDDDDDEDPQSKKRKRQLRNRGAAMRSRERKKMHVKDLEMKSRYFEDECRRLQKLLHCCYAENQWLRCSLQTYGAPMTKPESAVLLLESLLLGSLVWLMVNICLLPQPLLNQEAALLVSADRKILETAALRGKGTKTSELWISLSFTRSKRCKASRTKMKSPSPQPCF